MLKDQAQRISDVLSQTAIQEMEVETLLGQVGVLEIFIGIDSYSIYHKDQACSRQDLVSSFMRNHIACENADDVFQKLIWSGLLEERGDGLLALTPSGKTQAERLQQLIATEINRLQLDVGNLFVWTLTMHPWLREQLQSEATKGSQKPQT